MRDFATSILCQASMFCIALLCGFVMMEPALSIGATSDSRQFTTSQTIGKELAFASSPANVVMSPSLGGLTGGTALGSTQFAVISNSTGGYTVTIMSSSTDGRMIGNASSTNFIPGYVPSSVYVPDYAFTVPANKAYFGYTVESSTTKDVSSKFYDNGSNSCGGANTDHLTANTCWINASSTAVTILNRTIPTFGTPASTTLKFQVKVQQNPNPMLPNDVYVATTTLTATIQ